MKDSPEGHSIKLIKDAVENQSVLFEQQNAKLLERIELSEKRYAARLDSLETNTSKLKHLSNNQLTAEMENVKNYCKAYLVPKRGKDKKIDSLYTLKTLKNRIKMQSSSCSILMATPSM